MKKCTWTKIEEPNQTGFIQIYELIHYGRIKHMRIFCVTSEDKGIEFFRRTEWINKNEGTDWYYANLNKHDEVDETHIRWD